MSFGIEDQNMARTKQIARDSRQASAVVWQHSTEPPQAAEGAETRQSHTAQGSL